MNQGVIQRRPFRIEAVLLAAAVAITTSCSQSGPSAEEALSLIKAKLDDGDRCMEVIQKAASMREYWTMDDNYKILRSNYIEVASQIQESALSGSGLDEILMRLESWEDFIQRYRSARRSSLEPLPVASESDPSRRFSAEDIKALERELGISSEDKQRREQEWVEAEESLDDAIASVHSRRSESLSENR